ncbi:MAG: VOC family protein [Clostridiaceae bacterium]
MTRYVHTNIIASDPAKLIAFYKTVFGCQSIGETRDLRGEWLDRMTGIRNAHLFGEHLLLPGYGADHPTLEIFSYDQVLPAAERPVNTRGITHLAFEVEDVSATLERVLANGGNLLGELVHAVYEDGRKATFVYARDPEGNILELQSWS